NFLTCSRFHFELAAILTCIISSSRDIRFAGILPERACALYSFSSV
ncbi:MAG: hypothetical protein QOH71_2725, partial [Blastocatellia bacterium]|nr:hypothetical protein [Blastocatellia bacterium]